MASSMLGNISSLQGVSKAFSALGLSPDMISQFAPKILGFLGGEGVGSTALNSLKGLWGVAGYPVLTACLQAGCDTVSRPAIIE